MREVSAGGRGRRRKGDEAGREGYGKRGWEEEDKSTVPTKVIPAGQIFLV